ncbi:DUF3322 domain-containing protein [Ralstonia solanacearum]|uniref:DUF3322 domain-containing protein n=1 Tax=Ralstonia solanacearum TaxID=305 RepID=UPI0009BEBEAD|nr:DUF3322 domain-containing protein [Ralstonia solanacearum]
MNWSLPADLRAQVQRLWDRGELLRASVSEGALTWPLRLTLKTPTPADLSDRFEAVRDWVRSIADTPHVRMEWREWTHRVQGRQRLPAAAFVESLGQAVGWIGQPRATEQFRGLWQQAVTDRHIPATRESA